MINSNTVKMVTLALTQAQERCKFTKLIHFLERKTRANRLTPSMDEPNL